jgi:2,5-furandicarboxylate decarboxylase 1
MKVVIYVGHHPVLGAGAVFTGPLDLCEFDVVGGFLGRPLETVKAETSDLPVPAEAELAIEGTINPRNMETDGPFAEFTGYYGEVAKCYIINVDTVTRRTDMIYNDLSVGCWEHSQLNTLGATAAVHDAVARVVPTVKHVYLPPSGKGVLTAYISIPKRIEGEAKRAGMAAINSIPPVRMAVVVDEDINVYSEQEVMWAVATRTTPDQDIDIMTRVPGSILDPTSYSELRPERGQMTSKMIIDATRPLGLPFPHKIEWPEDLWRTLKLEDYFG